MIEEMNIEDLKEYKKNSKTHPEYQVKKIAASIQEFGFNIPILIDSNNVIIAGHGRLYAAKYLKLKTVPVIRKKGLTENQIKAYRIADNKTSESDWEEAALKDELKDLLESYDFDETLTGFDDDEISELLREDEVEVVDDEFVEVDAYERAKNKTKIKLGDIFELGDHRLMCGDSINSEDVIKLVNKNIIGVLFTDPPYNIGYKDLKGKHKEILNDKMDDSNFIEFIKKMLLNASLTYEKTKYKEYIFCNWKYYHLFYQAMENIGRPVKSCIVWDKEYGVQNLDKYHKQHEFILYHGPFGGKKTLRGDIYKLKRQKSDLHPTMKPIELCADFINDSGENNILDLFGGSGSTLIACEQLLRKCFMMELDPIYCEVICERWEKLTNQKRKKVV